MLTDHRFRVSFCVATVFSWATIIGCTRLDENHSSTAGGEQSIKQSDAEQISSGSSVEPTSSPVHAESQFASFQAEKDHMFGNSWVAHRKRTVEHPDNAHLSAEDRESIAWLWAIQWETSLNFYNRGLEVSRKNAGKETIPIDWSNAEEVHAMVQIEEPEIMVMRGGKCTIVFESYARNRRRLDE